MKIINELDPAASRRVSGRVANREVSAPPTTLQTPSSPRQAAGFSELRYKKSNYSVSEVAAMLGISRIAVFKKIQKKQIPAEKVGRNYIIHANNIGEILGQELGAKKKVFYNKAVKKVVKDYHRTLVLLGGE